MRELGGEVGETSSLLPLTQEESPASLQSWSKIRKMVTGFLVLPILFITFIVLRGSESSIYEDERISSSSRSDRNSVSEFFVIEKSFQTLQPSQKTAVIKDGPVSRLYSHPVDCTSYENGQAMLQSFEYNTEENVIEYSCARAPVPYPDLEVLKFETQWTDDSANSIAALASHAVYCPPDHLLSEWHLETLGTKIRMSYQCVNPTPAVECFTRRNLEINKGYRAGYVSSLGLPPKQMTCDSQAAMQGWSVLMNDMDNFHYEWTCCKVGSGFAMIHAEKHTESSEDGTLMYLDTQDVSCGDLRGSNSPISRFQYNATTRAYDYNCGLTGIGMTPSGLTNHFTPWVNNATSGNLDDLGNLGLLECPKDYVMMQFKLETFGGSRIRYNFKCIKYEDVVITCRTGYTEYYDIGKEFSLANLEFHNIRCDPHEAIGSFGVLRNNEEDEGIDSREMRYSFECCTAALTLTPVPSSVPTQSATTLMPVTDAPSMEPSKIPISAPTYIPTLAPSLQPSINYAKLQQSIEKVEDPAPTEMPSLLPTLAPTWSPTEVPSTEPSVRPTRVPSQQPSPEPKVPDTQKPTSMPITAPSPEPTQRPISAVPTLMPSKAAEKAVVNKVDDSKPEDARGWQVVVNHFGAAAWERNTRICPFQFVKGVSDESRYPGCALIVADAIEWMSPDEKSAAVYVCTDKSHPLELALQDLLALGLQDGGSEKDEVGISTMLAAKDVSFQGYYGPQFTNPAPSTEDDDGLEEKEEVEKEEKHEDKIEDIIEAHKISLFKQLSKAECKEGESFGIADASGVEDGKIMMWVSKGCRGVFKTEYNEEVECASVEFKLTKCMLPPSDEDKAVEEKKEEVEKDDDVQVEEHVHFTETAKTTGANEDSKQLIYLDRHDLNCQNSAIRQYHMRYDVGYDYTCMDVGDIVDTASKNNGFQDGPHLIYYDRQKVWCPNDMLMTRFHGKASDNRFGYEFECKKYDVESMSCSDRYTNYNEAADKTIVYLDRHDVKCSAGEGIQGFEGQGNNNGQLRIHYKCCSIELKAPAAAEKEDSRRLEEEEEEGVEEDKPFADSWEFDPDEIKDENDRISSITVASNIEVRIVDFPFVCGASNFSSVQDLNGEKIVYLRH